MLLIGCVKGYQLVVSPALPQRCKYYPSCSQYAVDALREYGTVRGLVLGGWRLLRCNPWSYGGYDPVERQSLFARGRRDAGCESGSVRGGGNPRARGVMPARPSQ